MIDVAKMLMWLRVFYAAQDQCGSASYDERKEP
jgi:hypothetical protein